MTWRGRSSAEQPRAQVGPSRGVSPRITMIGKVLLKCGRRRPQPRQIPPDEHDTGVSSPCVVALRTQPNSKTLPTLRFVLCRPAFGYAALNGDSQCIERLLCIDPQHSIRCPGCRPVPVRPATHRLQSDQSKNRASHDPASAAERSRSRGSHLLQDLPRRDRPRRRHLQRPGDPQRGRRRQRQELCAQRHPPGDRAGLGQAAVRAFRLRCRRIGRRHH